MKGLIVKDFLLIRKHITYFHLFPFLIILIPVLQNQEFAMPIISLSVSLLFAMQVLQTINFDENSNWNSFMFGMPLTKKESILSKYILSFILAILSLIVVTILLGILSIFIEFDTSTLLLFVSISFNIVLLYNSAVIPISLKYGSYNCRYIIMVFVSLPTLIAFILRYLRIDIDGIIISLNTLIVSIFSITILILIISYFISLKITEARVRSVNQR